MMARPALVAIRCRNPCFLDRRRLFGWNVLFTITPLPLSNLEQPTQPVQHSVFTPNVTIMVSGLMNAAR